MRAISRKIPGELARARRLPGLPMLACHQCKHLLPVHKAVDVRLFPAG